MLQHRAESRLSLLLAVPACLNPNAAHLVRSSSQMPCAGIWSLRPQLMKRPCDRVQPPSPNLLIPSNLQNFLDFVSASVVKYALQNDHDRSAEHAAAARHPPKACHEQLS